MRVTIKKLLMTQHSTSEEKKGVVDLFKEVLLVYMVSALSYCGYAVLCPIGVQGSSLSHPLTIFFCFLSHLKFLFYKFSRQILPVL